MRAVYDTNVYISGFLWRGSPRELIELASRKEIQLFVSEYILDEVLRILDEYFKLAEEDVESVMQGIRGISTLVYPRERVDIVRDKKDNRILECALESKADYLVTGDKDLLVLKEFKGIRIVSPREFLDLR